MRIAFISLCDRGNLGARQLVAQGKQLGHDGMLINFGEYRHADYTFSENADSAASLDKLAAVLRVLRPEMIGISYRSAMDWLAPLAAKAARAAVPNVKVIAGGIGATSDPYDAGRWADLVCIGEADSALADILQWPEKRKIFPASTWPHMSGALTTDLDSLPFPDYEGSTTWTIVRGEIIHPDGRLDNDLGAYPLLTSRGCVRACSYCHNSTVHALYAGQKYNRQRSVENVMAEIEWALGRWDIKLLSIYDDLFIADPDWSLEFAEKLPRVWPTDRMALVPTLAGGPEVRLIPEPRRRRFWFMAHPNYIGEEVVGAMVAAGCEEICLGVQSGSPRVLAKYRRGTTLAEIESACAILSRYPVAVKIDLITADPRFDISDDVATLRMIQRLPRKPNWHPGLSRLTVFPGTADAREIKQAQCDALHGPEQDFVDGLLRAAFVPRWYDLDLAEVVMRYGEFVAWCAASGRRWPTGAPPNDEQAYWNPLTDWLNGGAP